MKHNFTDKIWDTELTTKDETIETIMQIQFSFRFIIFFSKLDLTSLLELIITLVIIEINGASFALIFFLSIRDRKNVQFFFLIRGVGGGVAQNRYLYIYIF